MGKNKKKSKKPTVPSSVTPVAGYQPFPNKQKIIKKQENEEIPSIDPKHQLSDQRDMNASEFKKMCNYNFDSKTSNFQETEKNILSNSHKLDEKQISNCNKSKNNEKCIKPKVFHEEGRKDLSPIRKRKDFSSKYSKENKESHSSREKNKNHSIPSSSRDATSNLKHKKKTESKSKMKKKSSNNSAENDTSEDFLSHHYNNMKINLHDKTKEFVVDNKASEQDDEDEYFSSEEPMKNLKPQHKINIQNKVRCTAYNNWLQSKKQIEYQHVKEEYGDLFEVDNCYSLAHCVAEDFNMGSGIAVEFRQKFKKVGELLNQRQRTGGLAILKDKDRFIYYLVTKRISSGKPTLGSLWQSLNKLKDHMIKNNITQLAIPRIGCGLDRLEWCEVKPMIEYLFLDTQVTILVCNLKQVDFQEEIPQVVRHRNCKVVQPDYSLLDIEPYTIILYLCAEDGSVTEQIETINKKFDILHDYKKTKKSLGKIIRHEKNNYILYGFVVKKQCNDDIDYVSFQNCLNQLNTLNKKDQYEYVAIESFKEPDDFLVMNKIINLLRNGLNYNRVEVYICNPPT